MVPRKTENNGTTITINCAGTCQRVALGVSGILAVLIAVPIVLGAILLWGRALHHLFAWLLDSHGNYDAGPDLGAIFGVVLTIAGIVACVVSVFAMELRK